MTAKSLLLAAALLVSVSAGICAETQTPTGADVTVTFREWKLPTPGSHPHDPLAAADGSIWYTGQMASTLGRIDPRTGTITEFHTKTPDSGPHGLVADRDGNIWFTANFKAYIGKLDPRSGAITEYRLPDPNATDPHTPVFDQLGTLWFTVLAADMVGRLDPETGKVMLLHVPTPHAAPYGIAVNAQGIPFFAEFGTNKLASIDPTTLTIREYVLPDRASRPRRIAISRDGAIWFPITRAAISVVSIRKPDRCTSGLRQAGQTPAPMESQSQRVTCGTANRASIQTRSCASRRRRENSKSGRFPSAVELCAI